MHFNKILPLSSILILSKVLGSIADVDPDEVPTRCIGVCRPVIQGSRRCDNQTRTDTAEMQCMCRLANATTVIPRCEACVAEFHTEIDDDPDADPHDNDVFDIIQFCNFTTTTFGANTATGTATMTAATSTFT